MFKQTITLTIAFSLILGNKIGAFESQIQSTCKKSIRKTQKESKLLLSKIQTHEPNNHPSLKRLIFRLQKALFRCTTEEENRKLYSYCNNYFYSIVSETTMLVEVQEHFGSANVDGLIKKIDKDLSLLIDCVQVFESYVPEDSI